MSQSTGGMTIHWHPLVRVTVRGQNDIPLASPVRMTIRVENEPIHEQNDIPLASLVKMAVRGQNDNLCAE